MARKCDIGPDMTIDEVIRLWPQTLSVIIKNNMLCIGCALTTYHSVGYAAEEHDLDRDTLLSELNDVVNAQRE